MSAIEHPDEVSRRSFLQKSAVVAPVAAFAAAALAVKNAKGATPQFPFPDEYPGTNAHNFHSILKHEMAHVTALQGILSQSGSAYDEPAFVNLNQPNPYYFAYYSVVFENTGVAAYGGAAPLISDPATLATAASVAFIEARHAGFLNTLVNAPLSINNEDFQSTQTPMQVAQAVSQFFANPNLPLVLASQITAERSIDNDRRILKFALALEYLERRFYILNVPRFFG